MARANVARQQGDAFQARLFWLYAACLLDPHSNIIKVAYETGPKAFDDILIEYDPKAAPRDHEGQPIYRRHIQCKGHANAGTFGYAELTDPAFVNASRFSLLQRVHEAQKAHAPDGLGCRFELKTNWRVRPDDPLIDLIGKSSDAINLDRLFEGKTDNSRMGQVRKSWREHLGIDDDALRLVARVLAVAESPESLMSLRERLDDRFAAVGLKRVPASESGFIYDDMAEKLLAQGRTEFDRDSFREMARGEVLLTDPAPSRNGLTIGVRSFMHPIDDLENRCERMLDLVPCFDGRYIRNPADWQQRLYPALRDFVLDAARTGDRLRLVVDAHVSLAFAVGALLNVKSGKRIDIEQRTGGRRFWSMDDQPAEPAWPIFEFSEEVIDARAPEMALAVGLTHDVSDGVRAFIKSQAPGIGRILHCRPQGGPSQQSVRCGRHGWMLAESAVQQLRRLREGSAAGRQLHIFIAGPNAFAFFLGQHQQAIGPAAVYEWDFDGQRGGGYSLGLSAGA
ncbi:MAG: hypothetical protein CVT83_04895 [Alphaproteobacteria bacterium HGW-Alphaproteobacteria-5]|jgi:hypothetical protein|nr:MAG: hypothetical protein CVT83_04895 [Alphaproteobacteria bacterium HGW-Alphaproteobacteria-5]